MNPPYSYRSRHGIYYFRIVLPESSGGKEIRFSLGTRNPATAKKLAFESWLNIQAAIESGRPFTAPKGFVSTSKHGEGHNPTMHRSPLEKHCPETTSIGELTGTYDLGALQDVVGKAIKEGAELFAEWYGGDCHCWDIHDPDFEDAPYIPADAGYIHQIQIAIPLSHKNAIMASESGSFVVEEFRSYAAPHYKVGRGFVHRITPDKPLFLRVSELELSNDFLESFEFDKPVATATPNGNSSNFSGQLSEEFEQFCREKSDGGFWTDRSRSDYESVFKTFVEIVGDKAVTELNQGDVDRYISQIRHLPKNRRKIAQLKNLTATHAIELNQSHKFDVLSQRSLQKYTDRLVEPFNRFVQRGYCRYNYVSTTQGFKTKTRNPKEARDPFTTKDLKTIFESKAAVSMLSARKHLPSRPWGLLLGLFTGARASEIFGLTLADIFHDESAPYISITERDGERRLKNEHSIRNIPIHPKLVDLGFLEYCELARKSQKGVEQPMLFPDISYSKAQGWARNTCRWYNEKFLVKIGVKVDDKKVFHSFRHTVSDVFRKSDSVNRHKVSAYIGHADRAGPEWLSGAYGSDYKPAELIGICQQIQFDVDFGQLKLKCLDKISVRRVRPTTK